MCIRDSSYTIIYASVMVIIVAFLLAFVSSSLKSTQDKNCLLYTSFTGVFAGTEQVDDKYSGGFPLRQEAEYGVAQFFDGKLDVGFG